MMCSRSVIEINGAGKSRAHVTISVSASGGISSPRKSAPTSLADSGNESERNRPKKSARSRGISTGMYNPPSGADPRKTASRRDTSEPWWRVLLNFIARAGPANREFQGNRVRRAQPLVDAPSGLLRGQTARRVVFDGQ